MKKIFLSGILFFVLFLTSCHEKSALYNQTETLNELHDYYFYVYGDEFTEEDGGAFPENFKYQMTDRLDMDFDESPEVFPKAIVVHCSIDYELANELNQAYLKGFTIFFFRIGQDDWNQIRSEEFDFYRLYNSDSYEYPFSIYYDYNRSLICTSDGQTTIELLYLAEVWLKNYRYEF